MQEFLNQLQSPKVESIFDEQNLREDQSFFGIKEEEQDQEELPEEEIKLLKRNTVVQPAGIPLIPKQNL